jgi:hypothetical protein
MAQRMNDPEKEAQLAGLVRGCNFRQTMGDPEKELLVGKLVLEHGALEKQIGALRDEASERARTFARIGRLLVFQPERVVFEGQSVGEQFAGELVIDRKAMEVDSLIAELRATILRKKQVRDQLAEIGLDPEQSEDERNARASRALRHPAAVSDDNEDRKAKRLGFHRK